MNIQKKIRLLVVGAASSGKSSTINALLGKNVACINDDDKTPTLEIKRFEAGRLDVWDTPGFGSSLNEDAALSEKIEQILKEQDALGNMLIDAVLIVADASKRDMGTEYDLILNLLRPNMNEKQLLYFGLNQCDFAMKGKNWDSDNNTPNEILYQYLQNKSLSVQKRLKESTNTDIMPVVYSALYGYNIDKLKSIIITDSKTENNVEKPFLSELSIAENRIDSVHSEENCTIIARENMLDERERLENKQQKNGRPDNNIRLEDTTPDIYETIHMQITSSELSTEDQQILLDRVKKLKEKYLNIMLVGGTGVGKSSTINALFDKQMAEIGEGVDPQTNRIDKFILGNIVLWDTPGLGDSPEHDKEFSLQIARMLHQKNQDGNSLIDVVLVILDASVRDMGTAYELINHVVIPNLNDSTKILVALNQCDFAMKGKYWNHETNAPKEKLRVFLEKQLHEIQSRIKESTGLEITPIYYSALYHYNISKLFFYLLDSTPDEKRLMYLNQMNQNIQVWDNDDRQIDYSSAIERKFESSVRTVFDDLSDELEKMVYSLLRGTGRIIHRFIHSLFGKN